MGLLDAGNDVLKGVRNLVSPSIGGGLCQRLRRTTGVERRLLMVLDGRQGTTDGDASTLNLGLAENLRSGRRGGGRLLRKPSSISVSQARRAAFKPLAVACEDVTKTSLGKG